MMFTKAKKPDNPPILQQQQIKKDPPCPAVLLPILENEYLEERSRAERLDNKASALLTVIIALITVYVPIFPFDRFGALYTKARDCPIIPFIFSLFLFMAIIAFIISISSTIKLIGIHKPKPYEAINFSFFSNIEKLTERQVSQYQTDLIYHFQSIILTNSKINQHKADTLDKQYRNVIIIFVLLSISAIGTLTCITL